jgi:hypothetical protein
MSSTKDSRNMEVLIENIHSNLDVAEERIRGVSKIFAV